MDLRTRILLGYGYLVTLLVISAVGAALGFHQLSLSIGTVLTENVASVRHATEMLDALERQDSATLALLLGDASARDELTTAGDRFDEALAAARSNITLDEEGALLDDLESAYRTYIAQREDLLGQESDDRVAVYGDLVEPAFERVKTAAAELVRVNQEAMVAADTNVQRHARRRAILHGLLVTVALLSLGFVSRAIQRRVLDRVRRLQRVAEAVAAGDMSLRVPEGGDDELDVVAEQLNAVLDRLAEVEASGHGQMARQRQLLLALLNHWKTPCLLVDGNGNPVASTFDRERSLEAEKAVRSWIEHLEGPPAGGTSNGYEVEPLEWRRSHLGWIVARQHQEAAQGGTSG